MLKIPEIHVLLVIIVQHFQKKIYNFYANDDVIMNIHHIHNLCT